MLWANLACASGFDEDFPPTDRGFPARMPADTRTARASDVDDLAAIENAVFEGDRITRTQSAAVLEDLINQFIYSKAAEGKDSSK